MLIRIEKGSSVPISRQIAGQIIALCLSKGLAPGQQLPSVRELARDLAVNQNTILRVYERLTAEGYLERRHGSGTFVADPLPTDQLNGQVQRFEEELAQLVRTGRMLGLDDAQLRAFLDRALQHLNSPV